MSLQKDLKVDTNPLPKSPTFSTKRPLLSPPPPPLPSSVGPKNVAEPNSLQGNFKAVGGEDGFKGESSLAKKNSGLIRLLGAPMIDLAEAKKLVMEEVEVSKVEDDELGDLESPRIEFGPDGEYLDAANEESFTLDSFESLIRAARNCEKTFILARVTTVDPRNLARLYFSYYAAHHINRVIFRTQPEEGLLHRMKSRNPLNNMLIVGDVHYFSITPEDFDRALKVKEEKGIQSRVLRTTPSSSNHRIQGKRRDNYGIELRKSIQRSNSYGHRRSSSESAQLIRNHSTVSLPELSRVKNILDLTRLEGENDRGWAKGEEEGEENGTGTGNDNDNSNENENENENDTNIPIIYEASYFASDDDFLMKADVRDFFKRNSVNPDDYQLFQLNRRSDRPYELTVLGPDGRPLSYGSNPVSEINNQQQPRWQSLYGILDDGNHQSMIGGLHFGFLSPLGFWLSMLFTTAGVVFLSLILLPSPFHYFTLAGLVVLFVFVLLFFVNWDDSRSDPANQQ